VPVLTRSRNKSRPAGHLKRHGATGTPTAPAPSRALAGRPGGDRGGAERPLFRSLPAEQANDVHRRSRPPEVETLAELATECSQRQQLVFTLDSLGHDFELEREPLGIGEAKRALLAFDLDALRARQQRNFLATLLLSQGVPMLLGGDEIGRTQGGNNNAWCQDNEISWFDWDSCDEDLLTFVRQLIELRRKHHVFRRTKFFEGKGEQLPDVWWMRPDGRKMTQRDWGRGDARATQESGGCVGGYHAVEGCALQLDSAHDMRRDATERRTRRQRAPADRESDRELSRPAG